MYYHSMVRQVEPTCKKSENILKAVGGKKHCARYSHGFTE